MPYNFTEISDKDLKLFFAVINDLEHKAALSGLMGPLKFNNTPTGVTKDEQIAILSRLDKEEYISFSNDKKSIWLNEGINKNIEWGDVFDSVHKEYHKRFDNQKNPNKSKPHYDEINGDLYIFGNKIKIKKHDEDTKQNQMLRQIFEMIKEDFAKELDFSAFVFEDVDDKKKNKNICRVASKAINEKIAKETNGEIKEFIICNSRKWGWLKINPIYVEKLS